MNTPYTNISDNVLKMVFPQKTQYTDCEIEIRFHKTLRIPDDNKQYSLPPSLGHFPLNHVDDFANKLPSDWKEHGGIFLPMFQAEAMWMSFHSKWPFAVKIAAGKINAVSGDNWTPELKAGFKPPALAHDMALRDPKTQAQFIEDYQRLNSQFPQPKEVGQDYIIVPSQPWLDGFNVGEGVIRQFVAVPLNSGYTVEEQLTGKAEHGGLQIMVYPMKQEEFVKIDKPPAPRMMRSMSLNSLSLGGACASAASMECAPAMGMGAGGFMKQEIYEDKYGFDKWDRNLSQKVFVHLLNSNQYKHVTGKTINPSITLDTYKKYNYPWFDYYSDEKAIAGSEKLAKVDSIASMQAKNNENILGNNDSIDMKNIITIGKKNVKSGNW